MADQPLGPAGRPPASDAPAVSAADALAAPPRVRQLVAIKAVFSGEYSGVRGALLVVMDLTEERLERLYAVIAAEGDETRYNVSQTWKDFEALVINAKLQGHIAHQTTGEVTGYLRRVLTEEFAGIVCESLRHESPSDVRRILVDLVSRAIADTQILMELGLESVEELVSAVSVSTEPGPEAAAAAGPASATVKDVRVRVDPILSPVTGVPAKELKPGMRLRVQVRDLSTIKQHTVKMLAIKVGGIEKGILTGQVRSVAPTEHDRVSIELDLAQNVIGVASLSGELRIQIMDHSARLAAPAGTAAGAAAAPGLSSKGFLWASIAIVTFLVILAYLIFGGII